MKIVIFQPMLKFYRVPLFEILQQRLSEQGHELRLVFGTPWAAEQQRGDNVVIERDYCFYEKSHWFFNNKLHLLPAALGHIVWADLVITEQANRHLHNYLLIALSVLGIKPFAYWGHGLNRQGNPNSLREKLKKFLAGKVDWWFAYTDGVAAYLRDYGYPPQRITVLNNSIDTRSFKQQLAELSQQELAEFKHQQQLADDALVGLFCGSFHGDKKIAFLLEAATLIRQRDSRFVLLIGGAGNDLDLVERYAKQYDFIRYLGPLHGKAKSLAFKYADGFLNPGMVGLAVLDAFSAGLPVFTTHQAEHSPEIDYLQNGYNGMLSDLNLEHYAELVASTLASPELLASLQRNALASSEQFSIENMAQNFLAGIQSFMSHPHR